jgi:hypothetical protein
MGHLSYTYTVVLIIPEPTDDIKYNLQQLIQELYFDQDRVADFSHQEITRLAGLLGRLLRYHPSTRSTAAEILSDDWSCK